MMKINFHLTFSRQFGRCYKQVRFYLRLNPKNWQVGDHSFKTGNLVIFRMYCLGPFGVQWDTSWS